MIVIKHRGDFRNTEKFFNSAKKADYLRILSKYAVKGVSALSAATPIDSGKTSASWDYEIQMSKNSLQIYWTNSNFVDGISIAVILQYGHGTKTGGYVQGRNYIKPAIRPVFNEIAEQAWREVTKL